MGLFTGVGNYLAHTFARAAHWAGDLGRVEEVKPPPLWFNANRIGGELTPESVSQVLLQADAGYMYRLVDLARESREKDGHLHAVLSTLELSIAGMEVQIIPASDKARDRRIAAHVEQVFAEFGPHEHEPNAYGLADLVTHLTGGYYYGYAVAELLYRENRNGQQIPYACDPVAPRRFIFDQTTSKLHFFDYSGNLAYPGIDLGAAYPNKFITFQPIVLGTGPAREGLMRPLVWAALFRNWTIRDWLSLAELAWKPWRIGSYDKEKMASKADIDALVEALQYLSTNGQTLLPDTVDLKIEWPNAKGGQTETQHKVLADFMAAEMSKAVLGQTMTTDSGSSLSQAKVHKDVEVNRRNSIAGRVQDSLRWGLAARTVRLNYGPDVDIPKVRLVANDTDLAALADILLKLTGPKGLGVPLPLAWIRKMFGIPALKPGDEVIGPPVPLRVPETETGKRIAEHRMRVQLLADDADALRDAMAEQEAIDAYEREQRAAIDRAHARRVS